MTRVWLSATSPKIGGMVCNVTPCRMFNESVHASQIIVVRHVGCLTTCEMSSLESYLPPTGEGFHG